MLKLFLEVALYQTPIDKYSAMAVRPASVFSLMIINKAGGLIYQKNYAGKLELSTILGVSRP